MHTEPRIVPHTSGISAQLSRYAWSMKLRPIRPLEPLSPDASISRAFSIAFAHRMKTLARTLPVVCSAETRSL